MHNSGYFPPPVFNCPPPGPMIRPPVFNWRPLAPGTFCPENANWWQPPPGPWGFNSAGNEYNALGYQNAGFQPRRQYHNFGRQRGGSLENGPSRNGCGKQKRKKETVFTYFCDTCDRGFKDRQKYDDHVAQHVKCSVKDCSFTAHEKLVSLHWKNNHAPGAKRIKLDTPDEIAKWREERRKNYPTVSNVVRKVKMMEEREERGEVLETAQFGKMRRGRMAAGGRRGFERSNRGNVGAEDEPGREAAPKQTLNNRDPLGVLAQSDSDSDKDSAADGKKEGLTVIPRHMTSGLGSLLASYGSASDSDSEQEPVAMPILKTSKALEENQALLRSLPASAPRPAAQPDAITHPDSRRRHPQSHPQSARPHAASCRPGRGRNVSTPCRTMLEMLLAPEIRHERNVVLQCVRFIVQNSLFGLDRPHPENRGTSSGDGRTATGAEDHALRKDQLYPGYPMAHNAMIDGTRHGGGACEGGGRGLEGGAVIGGKEVIEERWQSPQVRSAVMDVDRHPYHLTDCHPVDDSTNLGEHTDRHPVDDSTNLGEHTDRHPVDDSTNLGEAPCSPAEETVVIQHCSPLGNSLTGRCDSLGEGPLRVDTPPVVDTPPSGESAIGVDTPPSGESAMGVDTPPVVETPPSGESAMGVDTPLSGESAMGVDTPPVVDTPPSEESAMGVDMPLSGENVMGVDTPPSGESAMCVDTPPSGENAMGVDTPPVVDTPPSGESAMGVDTPPSGENVMGVDTPPVVDTPPSGECAMGVDTPPSGESAMGVDMPPSGESAMAVDTPYSGESAMGVDMPPSGESAMGVDMPFSGESAMGVDTPPSGESAMCVDTPPSGENAMGVDTPPVVDTPPSEESAMGVDTPPSGENVMGVDTPPVVDTPPSGECAMGVDTPPVVDTPPSEESAMGVDTPPSGENVMGVDTPPVVDTPPSGECAMGVDTPPSESSLPKACPQDDEQSSGTQAVVIGEDPSLSLDTDESQKLPECNGSPPAHATGPHEGHCTAENTVIGGEHYLPKEGFVIGSTDSLAERLLGSEQPSCSVVDDAIWEIPAAFHQSQ